MPCIIVPLVAENCGDAGLAAARRSTSGARSDPLGGLAADAVRGGSGTRPTRGSSGNDAARPAEALQVLVGVGLGAEPVRQGNQGRFHTLKITIVTSNPSSVTTRPSRCSRPASALGLPKPITKLPLPSCLSRRRTIDFVYGHVRIKMPRTTKHHRRRDQSDRDTAYRSRGFPLFGIRATTLALPPSRVPLHDLCQRVGREAGMIGSEPRPPP